MKTDHRGRERFQHVSHFVIKRAAADGDWDRRGVNAKLLVIRQQRGLPRRLCRGCVLRWLMAKEIDVVRQPTALQHLQFTTQGLGIEHGRGQRPQAARAADGKA